VRIIEALCGNSMGGCDIFVKFWGRGERGWMGIFFGGLMDGGWRGKLGGIEYEIAE
jgi:hypothetical protein